MKQQAPYGSWPSPIGIDVVTSGRVRMFGGVWLVGDRVVWLETRPDEDGRMALVAAGPDGEPADLVPAGFNVRTRVHEYGGGACWFHGETAFCFDSATRASTGWPGGGAGRDHAGAAGQARPALRRRRRQPDGATIVCVRERHEASEIVNELVALPADGSGDAACSSPAAISLEPAARARRPNSRLDCSGTTRTCPGTAPTVAGRARRRRRHGGAPGGRRPGGVDLPARVAPAGVLHFCSDRTGWWNLYALEGGEARPIAPVEAEVGGPQWVFGSLAYAFLGDGRIARKVCDRAVDRLEARRPASGDVDAGRTALDGVRLQLAGRGGRPRLRSRQPGRASRSGRRPGHAEWGAPRRAARLRGRPGRRAISRAARDRVPHARRSRRARLLLPAAQRATSGRPRASCRRSA